MSTFKETNLYAHALQELGSEEGFQEVFALLEVFSNQNHSGFSAPITIETFRKLASFEPLGPLTGEDSEWVQVTDDLWQNKRDGRVFKKSDGQAYFIEGKIFEDPDGSRWCNSDSFVDVAFPCIPNSVIVKRDAEGNDL